MASGFSENQATNVEFKHFDVMPEASDHYYCKSEPSKNLSNSNLSFNRKIMKEWRSLEKDLPESIYVQVYETRIDLLRAVIIGSEGTPYHNGLFFFDICLPSHYPLQPPKVYYRAHGLRLNPNLYANGTVCLSLINTWSGENWKPNSTILQVLVSLQGLVLNARPYFNEPMYGHYKNSNCPKWIKASVAYNEKVIILTCKAMLYTICNPPMNFESFVMEHFCKHANSILATLMAYQDYNLLAGSCSIEASPTFKSNLMKIHSELQKVFDIVSEPNIKSSKKIENVKKATKWMMLNACLSHNKYTIMVLILAVAFHFLLLLFAQLFVIF